MTCIGLLLRALAACAIAVLGTGRHRRAVTILGFGGLDELRGGLQLRLHVSYAHAGDADDSNDGDGKPAAIGGINF